MAKKSIQAQAASMIRKELKENGIKAKVKSSSASMMNAVDIWVEDLLPATLQKVTDFCNQFEYGSFNAMEDIYECNNRRDDLPQVKYVSIHHSHSDELRAKAEAYLEATHNTEGLCDFDRNRLIWNLLKDNNAPFYRDMKPRVRAA